jgi:hypothetical protein
MRAETAIPLIWEPGIVGSVIDDGSILRLRQARDPEMEQEMKLTSGAAGLPTLAFPTHQSSSLSPEDVEAIVEEIEWHKP